MQHILTALEVAVTQQNWYAALSLTLTLPDICGKLEEPSESSQNRYVRWFDRFVASRYDGALSGNDCYALRCAFLHEGSEEITSQRAREVLNRFQFTIATLTRYCHCNTRSSPLGSKLQLQVDEFCIEFIEGGKQWLREVGSRPEVIERMASQLRIYDEAGNVFTQRPPPVPPQLHPRHPYPHPLTRT